MTTGPSIMRKNIIIALAVFATLAMTAYLLTWTAWYPEQSASEPAPTTVVAPHIRQTPKPIVAPAPAETKVDAEVPLPKKARVDFYTLVEKDDRLISLGPVSAEALQTERLDESCATIPGREVELVDEYGRFVHVRYRASEPREPMECPNRTSYFIEIESYRHMDERYAETHPD